MRQSRLLIICLIIISGIVLVSLYLLFDPASSEWFPQCSFYKLTGLKCPGCGSQRAFHALLNGDIASAWRQNALLLLSVLPIAFMIWLETTRKHNPNLYRKFYSPTTIILIAAAILAWTILRNIFDV